MSARYYLGALCLPSSSSTMLIDGDDVSALKTFKSSVSEPIIEDAAIVHSSGAFELLKVTVENKLWYSKTLWKTRPFGQKIVGTSSHVHVASVVKVLHEMTGISSARAANTFRD